MGKKRKSMLLQIYVYCIGMNKIMIVIKYVT